MREMNVSDAAVYMWESGKASPKLANLQKLAKLYGCSVDDLIGDE
jgi:transcriptional regulator with XRE-family HTH domain